METSFRFYSVNVLHFYKRVYPESLGGVEKAIATLCESTESASLSNIILALTSKNSSHQMVDLDYKLVLHDELFEIASTPISLSVFFKFLKVLKNVDLVHFHYPYPLANVLSLFCIDKPYIVTYHSDIVKQNVLKKIIYPLEWIFLKRATSIVATSPNYMKTSKFLQKFEDKTTVIPLGCNPDEIQFNNDKVNEYQNLIDGKPFFIFVGHNRYYKGLHILMEALENAPDINVVIAGENHQRVYSHAKSKNLKNIHFLDKVNDEQKYSLMKSSFGFVFPSHLRSEAFGIVLVEASLCGIPLITCEIGTGTSFVNIDQETGIVIKPSSSEQLIAAMRKLLNNPKIAMKYGENARKRALSLFTAKKQADQYLVLYEKIIGSNVTS